MFRSAKVHFIIGAVGLTAGAACLAQGTVGQGIAANGPIEIQVPETAAIESSPVEATEVEAPSLKEEAVRPAANGDYIADPSALDSIPTVGPFRPTSGGKDAAKSTTEAAVAESESKALGKPNKALAARPAAEGDSQTGIVSQLDPRTNDITRVAGALAAVIGLLLLLKAILKKVSGGMVSAPRPSGVVEVLARYPIARGQQFMLLKLARRILLLHQNGSALITLSEISDSNEVASILTRLEAGSSQRDAAKFRSVLEEFAAEHEKSSGRNAKSRVNLPLGDAEVVDLTRRSNRGLRGLLSLGGLW